MKRGVVHAIPATSATGNATGITFNSDELFAVSAQLIASGSGVLGTLKLQGSNDSGQDNYLGTFEPTNWTDIYGASLAISGSGSFMIPTTEVCYGYMRATYTSTATGVQYIAPIADTGVRQVQTVDTVADTAGSLNSKYFLVSSVNLITKTQKNFYVWYDDGGGVDPALAGKTGVQVTYTDGDSANTIASNTRTALNALTNDFAATGSAQHVIITNEAYGRVTPASAGTSGFTCTDTTPGVASNLSGKYFKLWSGNDTRKYYVWFNVDSISTDPAPAGFTSIEVDFSSGSSAATIGAAMATAIAAAHSSGDFSTTGTTSVHVTNLASGPFTPATDFNSGFGFTVNTPSGTITVNIKTLSQ